MMYICSDCDIDDSFPESNKSAYNDSSFMNEENFFEFNPNDFFVQKNKGNNYNEFLGNLFFSQYKEDNEYIEDDKKYQEQLYFFSFSCLLSILFLFRFSFMVKNLNKL